MSTDSTKKITSVTKALKILNIISQAKEGLTTTEISGAMGQSVSATYHILNTLRSEGFIRQDKISKKYYLGYALLTIAERAKEQTSLKTLSGDVLRRLTEETQETSNLVILNGSEIEYIEQWESDQLLKMFTKIGAKVPYSCTGGGKAIAAFLPQEERERLIANTIFTKFTDNTCVTRERLETELEKIKDQGYATDAEERELGVTCIAAPVLDGEGYPIAAVSISGPASRFLYKGIDVLAISVKTAAKEISGRLLPSPQAL